MQWCILLYRLISFMMYLRGFIIISRNKVAADELCNRDPAEFRFLTILHTLLIRSMAPDAVSVERCLLYSGGSAEQYQSARMCVQTDLALHSSKNKSIVVKKKDKN